jgi:hypothetical protein
MKETLYLMMMQLNASPYFCTLGTPYGTQKPKTRSPNKGGYSHTSLRPAVIGLNAPSFQRNGNFFKKAWEGVGNAIQKVTKGVITTAKNTGGFIHRMGVGISTGQMNLTQRHIHLHDTLRRVYTAQTEIKQDYLKNLFWEQEPLDFKVSVHDEITNRTKKEEWQWFKRFGSEGDIKAGLEAPTNITGLTIERGRIKRSMENRILEEHNGSVQGDHGINFPMHFHNSEVGVLEGTAKLAAFVMGSIPKEYLSEESQQKMQRLQQYFGHEHSHWRQTAAEAAEHNLSGSWHSNSKDIVALADSLFGLHAWHKDAWQKFKSEGPKNLTRTYSAWKLYFAKAVFEADMGYTQDASESYRNMEKAIYNAHGKYLDEKGLYPKQLKDGYLTPAGGHETDNERAAHSTSEFIKHHIIEEHIEHAVSSPFVHFFEEHWGEMLADKTADAISHALDIKISTALQAVHIGAHAAHPGFPVTLPLAALKALFKAGLRKYENVSVNERKFMEPTKREFNYSGKDQNNLLDMGARNQKAMNHVREVVKIVAPDQKGKYVNGNKNPMFAYDLLNSASKFIQKRKHFSENEQNYQNGLIQLNQHMYNTIEMPCVIQPEEHIYSIKTLGSALHQLETQSFLKFRMREPFHILCERLGVNPQDYRSLTDLIHQLQNPSEDATAFIKAPSKRYQTLNRATEYLKQYGDASLKNQFRVSSNQMRSYLYDLPTSTDPLLHLKHQQGILKKAYEKSQKLLTVHTEIANTKFD